MPLTTLNNGLVRHLHWSLCSPALIQSQQADLITESPALIAWLRNLDADPTPLQNYLNQNNHRLLGSYFECLWQFYFENYPDWELLAHHVQIFDNHQKSKPTIGELDVLAASPITNTLESDNKYFHFELAVKFYLQKPNSCGNALSDWLGPQANDRLDLKYQKLTQKQLPFIHHPATEQTLKNRQLEHDYKSQLISRGCLMAQWQQAYELPEQVNPDISMGQWLFHKQLGELLIEASTHWAIIDKHNWLGPFLYTDQKALLSAEQVKAKLDDHFQNHPYKHAIMLVKLESNFETKLEKKQSETQKVWLEKERYMVVHDEWPRKVIQE